MKALALSIVWATTMAGAYALGWTAGQIGRLNDFAGSYWRQDSKTR